MAIFLYNLHSTIAETEINTVENNNKEIRINIIIDDF